MDLAATHDLPVLLHTPNQRTKTHRSYRSEIHIPGYEKNTDLEQDPVLVGDNPALEAVKIDIEAMDATGLDDEHVVVSHADRNNLDYVMEQTDCYLSFTLGNTWLTDVTAEIVADTIEEHGSNRIMIDTDCANVLRSDPFALKRAILELYRYGIDEEAIRTVVQENPIYVFDFRM